MQRIGVFVCHCGSNIAATVDVKKVVEMVQMEPGVVHAEDYQYMCSEAGQVAEHFPHFMHFNGFTPLISLIFSA